MAGTLKVGGVTLATHSDATGLVSMDNNIVVPSLENATFPSGSILQTHVATFGASAQATSARYYYANDIAGTSATGTPMISVTSRQENTRFTVYLNALIATGSHSTSAENNIYTYLRYSLNSDMSSATNVILAAEYQDMRAQGDLPQQTMVAHTGGCVLDMTNSVGVNFYFALYHTVSGWSAGLYGSLVPAFLTVNEVQK